MVRFIQIAVLFVLVAGAACGSAGDKAPSKPVHVQCDVHNGACEAKLGDRMVTMDVTPKPVKTMSDLRFVVTVSRDPLKESPYIDLNMRAMDMGPNRIVLRPDPEGSWTGTGVIVKCASGKLRWKALVTVPDVGAVEFYFDVQP